MEKEFVPYKLAIKLKELGFDEPCMSSRDMNNGEGLIQLPLYQQAFRWFREKHGLRFSIVDDHSDNEQPYSFTTEHEYYYDTGSGNNWFKTYEEAELACLEKLIEIVETKSE
jgi:hypothetical protein